MRKLTSFLIGLCLLAITFAVVFFTALTYRASESVSIKSYIFQTNNSAGLRVGALQDINDISAIDLRNKLIKKYVSEYFRVVPGDSSTINRPILKNLSSAYAYNQWLNGEAKDIEKMALNKMFRTVRVMDDGIKTIDKPADYDYYSDEIAQPIFYEIHYFTETWKDSNIMMIEPEPGQGYLYIQARFKPGIDETKDIKKYLENGENPVGLFMFEVVNIGSKGLR
jgi:hypothetical protein